MTYRNRMGKCYLKSGGKKFFEYHLLRGCTLRIAVGITVLAIILLAGAAEAEMLNVSASGGADFTRIQDAINMATAGDTIEVNSGPYYENVNVTKQLILRGIGMPVVDARGSGSAITLAADGIILEGFTATGGGSNNGDSGIKVTSNNNMLSGNNASNNYYGIWLSYSSNNTLTGNTASSNNNAGVELFDSSSNILAGNTANSNNEGISLAFTSYYNTLTNNTAKENSYYDIYPSLSVCNNIIENNMGSGDRQIKYFNQSVNLQNETLSELILCDADNSNINNITIESSATKKNNGLLLILTDNSNITNINSSNTYKGSLLYRSNSNNLINNIVNSNMVGIDLEFSIDNYLINNTANSNSFIGFSIYESSNNTLKSNSASMNSNGVGIIGYSSGNNRIYNNLFNNSNNFWLISLIQTNSWNITKQLGTNIIGGSSLGGNFWAYPNGTGFSQTCPDIIDDGICDSSYTLDTNNTDYLALAIDLAVAIDTTIPVITLLGESPINVSVGSIYTDAGATVTDNYDTGLTAIMTGTVNTSLLGSYTLTYNAVDSSGNSADPVTRIVNVNDTEKPQIIPTGNISETVQVGSVYIDAGAIVIDNYDTRLNATMTGEVNTFLLGSYVLTYNAVDSSGNAANPVYIIVNVIDTVKPVITLNGNNPETSEVGSDYIDAGATVTDNYDSGLTAIMTGTVNISLLGSYTLTYNAVDYSGNEADPVTRTVNVIDINNTAQNITIGNNIVEPVASVLPTTYGGGSSGSTGGGGGGVTSGENYSNIEVIEKYDMQISKDALTSYRFTHAKNPIMFVNITGNTSLGIITTSIEVLKNTSTLVKFPPEGLVYKNVNIWVGTSGFATPKNIKDAFIKFKIDNEWMSTNGVSAGDIVLMKWDGEGWISLKTTVLSKDDMNSYFEGWTNSFSPFAIVAKTADVPTSTSEVSLTKATSAESLPPEPVKTEKSPGICLYLIIGVILVAAFFRKNK